MQQTFSPLIDNLIQALRCLPGIGPKSAQRLALHILQHDKKGGGQLAEALHDSINKVGYCKQCRTLSETELCRICANPKRLTNQLCIVESPADILAIESTGHFQGIYFVLQGLLSPLDGIGPSELGLGLLDDKFAQQTLDEIIVAISATVEGEATAYYISELAKNHNLKITRLAQGVPLGGELEYIDSSTLAHAFNERKLL